MELSGISFYDFLGKLIPGTLIWAPWILISYQDEAFPVEKIHNIEFLWIFILLVGFYLTGLMWDFIIKHLVFQRLRLLPCMLIKAKNEYYKDAGKPFQSNPDCRMIKREYVKAYYLGLEKGVLRDLPVMESHENFLKTNWILIGVYAVLSAMFLERIWGIVVSSLLVIALLAIPFIWYQLQLKIYYSVWEAEDNVK